MLFLISSFYKSKINNSLEVENKRMSKMLEKAQAIELLSLGNSLNICLVFENFDKSGFTLWKAGNDFETTYYEFAAVVKLLPHLKFIIIPINNYDFSYSTRHERNNWRSLAYASNPRMKIMKGDFLLYVKSKLCLETGEKTEWINFLFKKRKLFSSYYDDYGQRQLQKEYNYYYSRDSLLLLSELERKAQDDIISKMEKKERNVFTINIKFINKLINEAKKSKLTVFFYSTPFYFAYYDQLDKNRIELKDSMMAALVKIPDVFYLNYSRHEDFIYDHTLYKDPNHLNFNGSVKFSKLLNKTVNECLKGEQF